MDEHAISFLGKGGQWKCKWSRHHQVLGWKIYVVTCIIIRSDKLRFFNLFLTNLIISNQSTARRTSAHSGTGNRQSGGSRHHPSITSAAAAGDIIRPPQPPASLKNASTGTLESRSSRISRQSGLLQRTPPTASTTPGINEISKKNSFNFREIGFTKKSFFKTRLYIFFIADAISPSGDSPNHDEATCSTGVPLSQVFAQQQIQKNPSRQNSIQSAGCPSFFRFKSCKFTKILMNF